MLNAMKTGEQYVFEICAFIVSSANLLFREPPDLYGPIRLLQTFSMIATLPEYVPGLLQDPFLIGIKEEVDRNIIPITTAATKEEKLELARRFINNLSTKLAKELKDRKQHEKRETTK